MFWYVFEPFCPATDEGLYVRESNLKQEARVYAEEHGTSLNAMIRDFLVRLTTDDMRRSEAARTFREVAAAVGARRSRRSGYKFRRADAYDREAGE